MMWTPNMMFASILFGITVIFSPCWGSGNLTGECPLFCNCVDFQNLDFRQLKCKNIPGTDDIEQFLDSLENQTRDFITEVQMEDSNLRFVPSSLLCKPRHLKYISLNGNSITLHETKDKLKCEAQIMSLELSKNEIKVIPVNYFKKYIQLIYLNLSWNHITEIQGITFLEVPKLRWLSLEYNELTVVDAWVVMLPAVLHGGKLVMVNMSHNYIHSAINTVGFSIQQLDETMKLSLDVSYNNITTLTSAFDALHLYKELSSINDLRKVINIYIALHNNPFMCDCDFYPFMKYAMKYLHLLKSSKNNPNTEIQCYGPERLEGRIIVDLNLTEYQCSSEVCLTPGCQSIETPDNSTIRVNCNNNSMTTFPTFKNNSSFNTYELYLSNNRIDNIAIPPYFPNVKIVDLSNNRIKLWNKERLGDMKNLRILMLQNNDIETLSEGIDTLNLLQLTLSGNPIICDCTNNWLKTWTNQSKHPISDVDKIKCNKPSRNRGKLFLDLPMDEFECSSDYTLVIAVSVSVIFIIIIAICIVLNIFKDYIHLFLFTRFGWRFGYKYKAGDKDYDVFISYSNLDEDKVSDIVNHLEKHNPPFRVAIHYRDFVPGESIAVNVVRCIEASKCTLLIISENFVKSSWCKYEFRAAHYEAIKEHQCKVLLVLLDKLGDEPLDKELKLYIKTHTYLEKKDPKFNARLLMGLPRPCGRRNSIGLE